ncbi:hypothetical protein BDN72DRAFT_649850 [Pluteus cervinus]|uniref:Uncharacterized protein n=1 Tax=Pluteus cervinus TaxID=181527 RepID=A0ACD3ATK3_9AGAR|nr:hypothetical protein BDN72DRAFT_649850 [Pluteus cervinus]
MIHLVIFNTGEVPISSEACSPTDTPINKQENAWSVDVSLNGELVQKALTLTSPVGPAEEQECLWYLEGYTGFPYHANRAQQCVQILDRYATSLYSQLCLDKILLNHQDTPSNSVTADSTQTLLLEVVETTTRPIDSSIHRLYWELLLRLPTSSLFQPSPASVVGKVIITRSFLSDDLAVNKLPTRNSRITLKSAIGTKRQIFNVLLVIARDLDPQKQEADPTIGLEPLLAIQKELQQRDSGCLLSVEVVRPGTFSALTKHLKSATQEHGKGYYHLVHFDVHGMVKMKAEGADKRSKVPTAGLLFAPKEHGRAMDFVPAKKIVTLLHEHKIELVFLNACESANSRSGDSANLAKALLDEGIYNVVAMQCKVMSGAAMLFGHRFYQKFIQECLSFSEAVGEAQLWLSEHTQRSAKYGLEVSLQDWIVPVAYVKEKDAQIVEESSQVPKAPLAQPNLSLPEKEPFELIGRGRDCLALERDLVESGLVFLHGVGGVGKSALLQRLISVWEATRFTKRVLYVDFASDAPINHCCFVACVRSQINPSSVTREEEIRNLLSLRQEEYSPYSELDLATFIDDLHAESTILILDSLDLPLSLHRVRSMLSDEQQNQLVSLIYRIIDYVPTSSQKKPLFILTSRHDEFWWNRHFPNMNGRYFHLQGIDIPSIQTLAFRILHRQGVDTTSWGLEEIQTLQHLLTHLDRNPLALELLLPVYGKRGDLNTVLTFLFNVEFHYIRFRDIKPSLPGGDRMLRDFDQLVTSIGSAWRLYLRCLLVFWLEGPTPISFIGAMKDQGLPTEPLETEKGLSAFLSVLYDVGAFEFPRQDTMPLRPLHPVFTLYLRCWSRQYEPGELRVTGLQVFNVFRFSWGATVPRFVFKSCLGDIDPGTRNTMLKRSLINAMTCMKIYSRVSFPIDEWPRHSIMVVLDQMPDALHNDIPAQKRFMQGVRALLFSYVKNAGDNQKALKPDDLKFALRLSNCLSFFYRDVDFDFEQSREAQQIDFSLSLIETSRARYGFTTVPRDMYEMAVTFRLKAKDSLYRKKLTEAEKYWQLQTEFENKSLDETFNNAAWREKVEGCSDPTLIRAQQRLLFYAISLPEYAKARQAHWQALVKHYAAEPEVTIFPRSRPAQDFSQLEATLANVEPGYIAPEERIYAREPGSRRTKHASFASRYDAAVDKGHSRNLYGLHGGLHIQAVAKGNWIDADIHAKAMAQHLDGLDHVPEELRSSTTALLKDQESTNKESQEELRTHITQFVNWFLDYSASKGGKPDLLFP